MVLYDIVILDSLTEVMRSNSYFAYHYAVLGYTYTLSQYFKSDKIKYLIIETGV